MLKNLLVEGWRNINHSYSMVNQYQLMELRKIGKINLYHNDQPFYRQEWSPEKNSAGFESDKLNEINSIPHLNDETLADVTYRISYPYRFGNSKSKKLFIFGTSEYQVVTNEMIFRGDISKNYNKLPLNVITPSNWSKQGFINLGFNEEQVTVIPHGIDPIIFYSIPSDLRDQYRALLGADRDTFVILSVGAMTENKGIDILLSAYLALSQKNRKVMLVLKDQSKLYQLGGNDIVNQYCRRNGINIDSIQMREIIRGIVCITDNLNLVQLNGLYGASDCYCSPYRAEGFNIPPLEAAAAGIPIVVTKGGSTDDYVDPTFSLMIESQKKCIDGRYFLEPNLESLIEQLSILIENKSSGINLDRARSIILERFSWSTVSARLLDKFLEN